MQEDVKFKIGNSAIGRVLVARTHQGLCAVLMDNDEDALMNELRRRFPNASVRRDDDGVRTLTDAVVSLIDGRSVAYDAPLDLRGTPFQQQVWQELRRIPAGTTASYTDVAQRIGRPRSVRAVAQACGANPLAVVVPCHRVIGRDGAMTGYRWGVERKRFLLEHECARASESVAGD
ncbi:hypothetical protein BH23GEM10_BH23GEM10_06330 [soil metagenome]